MALSFPSSPTTGQVFAPGAGLPTWMWDGSKWTNATTPPLHLASLSDVALSSPTAGQALEYNGTSWVNAPFSGSGSFNATLSGPFAASLTAPLKWAKVGGIVSLWSEVTTVANSTTTGTMTIGGLPSAIQPQVQRYCVSSTYNGGTTLSHLLVNTDGTITCNTWVTLTGNNPVYVAGLVGYSGAVQVGLAAGWSISYVL